MQARGPRPATARRPEGPTARGPGPTTARRRPAARDGPVAQSWVQFSAILIIISVLLDPFFRCLLLSGKRRHCLFIRLCTEPDRPGSAFFPGYPIDGNRWSENQSINRYQSLKLLNWYRLASVNRWSIDNHTKIVHRLASIGTVPRNRRHAHYLSDHPPFLGSPVDKTGKTIPISCFSAQRIYSVARVLEESG